MNKALIKCYESTKHFIPKVEHDVVNTNSQEEIYVLDKAITFAGEYRFKMDRTNGYGGSGELSRIDNAKGPEVALAVFDVLNSEGRSSVMLQILDGKTGFMGDCKTASELKAQS